MTKRSPFSLLPILPDELLISWVGRVALRLGGDFRNFIQELGARRVILTLSPVVRSSIENSFTGPPQLAWLQLVQRHTPLAYERILAGESEWKDLVNKVLNGAGPQPVDLFGRRLHKGLHRETFADCKVCPDCRTQEETEGFRTWRVTPNIPGMRYCAIHGCELLATGQSMRRVKHPPSSGELRDARPIGCRDPSYASMHRVLARDLAAAICVEESPGLEQIRKSFRYAIRQRNEEPFGFALNKLIRRELGADALRQIGMSETTASMQFTSLLTYGAPAPEPIYAAVAARALGTSLVTLINNATSWPDDRRAWRCLNRHSACYDKATIRDFRILGKSAEFRCPVCSVEFRCPLEGISTEAAPMTFVLPKKSTINAVVSMWESYRGDPTTIATVARIPRAEIWAVANVRNLPARVSERPGQSLVFRSERLRKALEEFRQLVAANPAITSTEAESIMGSRVRELRTCIPDEFAAICPWRIKKRFPVREHEKPAADCLVAKIETFRRMVEKNPKLSSRLAQRKISAIWLKRLRIQMPDEFAKICPWKTRTRIIPVNLPGR